MFMCAIDAATVKQSVDELRQRRPQTKMTAPPASIAPSTSTPPSSTSGVTLKAIMAQLVRMDAHLDTLSNELCQIYTHVSRIARQQAVMGGFTVSFSPSPPASKDESDDGSSSDDADEDDNDGLPSDDEIST